MATVTGDLGGQPISLDNAATENTLRELLAAVNRQTAILGRRQQGGAQQAGGANPQIQQQQTQAQQQNTQAQTRNTQATNQNSTSANASSRALDGLAKTAGVLGGIVGDLASSAFKTAGNLTDFAGQLIDGQGSLSGFYDSLKDLPLGMGMVAGLFAKIAKMQEAELNTYRTLQTAGVNFGGSLTQIRQNALDLGMTMDQYAGVVTKNSEVMQMLGGSTNQGAQNFTRLNKELRNSPLGAELRALGFTAEQTANGMASYIKMTGGRTQDELKNTKAIAEAAAGYMKNLNVLSQLTGESAEQLEQKMAEEANEASFQAYLQTLDEEGRKKALQGLQDALATGGKGGAQAFKDKIQGLPPMTEAGQAFSATMARANKAQDAQIAAIKDSSKSLEDVKKAGDAQRVAMAEDTRAFGAQTAAALSRSNDATGEMLRQGLKVQNQLNTAGVKNAEDETARRKKLEEEQKQLSKSAAASAAESEKAFKDMGAAIYGALAPAISAIVPIINDLAQKFMGFVVDNLPAIKEALTNLAVLVSNFAKNLFTDAGRDKIINDAIYFLKLIWIGIKEGLPSILGGGKEKADREREALKAEKEGFDKRAEAARTAMENSRAIAALELGSNEKKMKEHQAKMASVDAEIKKLEDEKKNNKNFTAEQQRVLDEKNNELKKLAQQEADAKNDALKKQGEEALKTIEKQKGQASAADASAQSTRSGAPAPDVAVEDLAGTGGLAAAKGGIFKGPESGFPVMLHGHEAVVPMENIESVSKSILPDLKTNVSPAVQPTMDIRNIPPITLDSNQVLGKELIETLRKEISTKSQDTPRRGYEDTEHFGKWFDSMSKQSNVLSDLVKSFNDKVKDPKSSEAIETLKKEFSQRGNLQQQLALVAGNGMNPDGTANEAMKKFMDNESKMRELSDKINEAQKPKIENLQDGIANKIKSIFPDFSSKLPSIGDLGSKLKESIKDVTGVSDINKQLEEIKKASPIATPEELLAKNSEVKTVNENLIKELQTLNKQTSEMVKYLRMNVDEAKQTSSGLRSLSGNLYI